MIVLFILGLIAIAYIVGLCAKDAPAKPPEVTDWTCPIPVPVFTIIIRKIFGL